MARITASTLLCAIAIKAWSGIVAFQGPSVAWAVITGEGHNLLKYSASALKFHDSAG